MRSTRCENGHIIEVYCLSEDRDVQVNMPRAWQLAWDFKRRAKTQRDAVEAGGKPCGPTLAGKSDFKGLRYYGVRFNGGFWVRSRDMTYCFSENPNTDLFTKDPSRAKVWASTRMGELKKVIKMGTSGRKFDWNLFEVVNMHNGASAPLQRILMEDKLTLE